MQTVTEYACYVESSDIILHGGKVLRLDNKLDEGDLIVFWGMDEEEEYVPVHVAPFDHVAVITSFEEEVEFEDVDIPDDEE